MLSVHYFMFSPISENTYIVYNESGACAIVDPGCYYQEEKEELSAFIAENDLKPQYLLNTHCHLDHVFGNKYVADTYGLQLHIHEKEKTLLDFAPASGLMYNLPFDNYDGKIHYLEPGTTVAIGDDVLEILFTPGHSPGSISFYDRKGGFILSGDALFRGSIGRTDLPGGDFDTLIKSIRQELLVLPGDTLVYSGHGDPTTIEEEKANNPFLQH
jgi:hydroxyacylglutathione hydrolase